MRRVIGILALGMILALGVAARAAAHDLWWEREDGGFVLRYGHLPGAHEGQRELPYEAAEVAAVHVLGAEGNWERLTVPTEAPVRIRGPWAALVAEMTPVVWTKTPYGTVRAAKSETEMPVASWESRESVKRIERWRPELSRPLGASMEIVPAGDPTELRPGRKLRVIVMLEGEPVEGATVAYDGSPRGVTGTDGAVNLKIRHAGWQNIQASLEQPLDGVRADKVITTAALVFELEEGS